MSIATQIQALQADKTAIANAITAKGGTVTAGDGFDDFANDIATIPSGGGGNLKDISPVTKNGTYNAGNNLTVLNSITLTGNAYIPTDINVPNGCNWNIEAKFKVTQVLSDTNKSALFGAKGTSYQVLFNQTANAFYLYMHGEYAYNITPQVGTEYSLIKNGSAATINGSSMIKQNDTEIVVSNPLDLFAYNEGSTHSRLFIGEFNYLKIIDNGTTIHWFVPVKDSNNVVKIFDKAACYVYSFIGTGVTAGTVSSDSLYDGFASPLVVNVDTKKWGVSADNYWRMSAKTTPDLEDLVIPNGECPRMLGYVFQYSGLKSITINDNGINNFGGMASGSTYVFRNNPNLERVLIDCGERTTVIGSSALSYGFLISSLGSPPENPTATFEFRIQIITGQNCLSYMFQNNVYFKYFSFPNLKKIGNTAYACFGSTFYNTNQCYGQTQANINQFRFPVLSELGANSTSYYGEFKSAFSSSYSSSTCHYGEVIFPELTTAYCRSSSSTNGHFNGCTALNKVYMPKLNNIGTGTTYSKYMFTNCGNLTEIHFGIENQATIEAMDGYATKFGATNSTLYFDMPNHITVGEVVYDRSGAEYDYDTSHYSWKNGDTVIYTTNAIDPAVGDTAYTKSDDTYIASGTIIAIS